MSLLSETSSNRLLRFISKSLPQIVFLSSPKVSLKNTLVITLSNLSEPIYVTLDPFSRFSSMPYNLYRSGFLRLFEIIEIYDC